MCDLCEAFHDDVVVDSSDAWRTAVVRARSAIADGVLELADGPPLGEARPPEPRKHVLQCATCGQLFILEAGGGHVLGDRWRPLHGN
jgi:hypothetical protein